MDNGSINERHSLIIRKIRKCPATFEEIIDYLSIESDIQEKNFVVSIRTFQRDIEQILLRYNIEIKNNKSNNTYYLVDDGESIQFNERVLEAFDTFNALNVSERLSQHLFFDNRIPPGTEHLQPILQAIKNSTLVEFVYTKFNEEQTSGKRLVCPLGLKEFRYRWYMIAKDTKGNAIKTFGLDRISDLKTTRLPFERPKDFNLEEMFRYCFGITSPKTEKPSIVELSFVGYQRRYIQTLPLHATQITLVDNEKEFRVQLKLFISREFVMELLSYGNEVQVLKPARLKKQVEERNITV